MFECNICMKKFKFQSYLDRHCQTNSKCRELKRINDKYSRLKEATRAVVEENKELRIKLKEREELTDKIILSFSSSKSKQTKIKINNNNHHNTNVVLQDFTIKSAQEINPDYDELADVIYNKSVIEACHFMIEKYYKTIPPNIKVADQARKKIFVVRNNQWVQENIDVLAHQLFHRSLKRLAFNCIQRKIDEHEEFLDDPLNRGKIEELEYHREELEKWKRTQIIWNSYTSQDFHKPLMIACGNINTLC
jgi:hypothetical protein